MKRKILLMSIVIMACCSARLSAQNWAVKTNLLYDATCTFNFGIETAMSQKWTFDLSGNYNPFTFNDNKKWKHWMVQPEFRYWFCRSFGGHFLAMHLLGGEYNAGNVGGLPDFWDRNFQS